MSRVELSGATDPSALRSNGSREVVLAVLASLGLVVAFTAANPTSRGASYDTTAASSVLLFYLIGNLYRPTRPPAAPTWLGGRPITRNRRPV